MKRYSQKELSFFLTNRPTVPYEGGEPHIIPETMNDTKDILYLAMARGIFMGLADMGNMDALFPEVNGDWHGASNNPEKIQKLANILRDNQSGK